MEWTIKEKDSNGNIYIHRWKGGINILNSESEEFKKTIAREQDKISKMEYFNEEDVRLLLQDLKNTFAIIDRGEAPELLQKGTIYEIYNPNMELVHRMEYSEKPSTEHISEEIKGKLN